MSGRALKQEQEPATDEIVEVAPGVLRAQLPIALTGLGHVNCYLLEDRDGVAVVDPGLPDAASFRVLRRRLDAAGFPIARVHTVVVTHSHPDHFGGAGRLRHRSGARIVTHRKFRLMWDPAEPPDVDVEELRDPGGCDDAVATDDLGARRFPWQAPPWGGDGVAFPWRRKLALRAASRFPRLMRTPTPTVGLDDADSILLAGRRWVALHTPGHTDDHLCLYDPAEGVMLSGDHVLPTITPHIGGLTPSRDPLAAYFDSLAKIGAYGDDVAVVLPAHGHPFSGLSSRAAAIRDHHLARLDRLRRASDEHGRPMTVAEFSTHLFPERSRGPMADSETFAHLEHLRRAGELVRSNGDGRYRYAPAG